VTIETRLRRRRVLFAAPVIGLLPSPVDCLTCRGCRSPLWGIRDQPMCLWRYAASVAGRHQRAGDPGWAAWYRSMARKRSEPPPIEPREFRSLDEIDQGIEKLQRRIRERPVVSRYVPPLPRFRSSRCRSRSGLCFSRAALPIVPSLIDCAHANVALCQQARLTNRPSCQASGIFAAVRR
jgi:hypothetical protein